MNPSTSDPIFLQTEWFWSMMQFFAVTTSLVAIYWQIRLQRATHVITAMTIFDDRWRSEQMLLARREYCLQYDPRREGDDPLSDLICPFFEDLGTYVRRKALPLDVVFEYFSYAITHYWQMSQGAITRIRNNNDPAFYTEFEYLHRKILKLGKAHLAVEEKASEHFRRFEIGRIDIFLKMSTKGPSDDYCAVPQAPK